MYVSRAPVQENILVSGSAPESLSTKVTTLRNVCDKSRATEEEEGEEEIAKEFNETESKKKWRHLKRERPAGMDGEVKVRGAGLPEWTR